MVDRRNVRGSGRTMCPNCGDMVSMTLWESNHHFFTWQVQQLEDTRNYCVILDIKIPYTTVEFEKDVRTKYLT